MRILIFFAAVGLVLSCNSGNKKEPSIYSGNINLGVDESLKKVVDAESDAYMVQYSGAKIKTFTLPENKAIELFLMDSMNVIAISRLLNQEELEIMGEDNQINYRPAPMALDAVVLIVNPESSINQITADQLRKLFVGEEKSRKLVFDNGNSSNLNLVMEKLQVNEFSRENVVSAGGNEKVFDWVKKDKNAIGFIGYNLISEKSSAISNELKNSIKILAVQDSSEAVSPNKTTILNQTYPFNRTIYLHTITSTWGVENGLIRYACSKPGQLIAEKMGLVPYYAIPKEFVLSNEPLD